MIYFLDNDLQLQKIVTSKNIYETNHEHELNGYIIADMLLPLDYVKKFIDKVEYFGYYYRGTFYLHKIQSTEDLHQDDVCLISGRHIFFDDMLYGKLIEDVRPQNRNAQDILNSTIAMNSRWRPQLVDTTGTLSTNFYWQPMFDVIEFVNKEFRLDFLPKVLFDGQKINGFDIEFAEQIGNDTAIRIPFGYRTLELTHEVDYSEIVTKLVVHGKGEEVGDGYGRRINISDVDFSRNGVKSPKGSLYLEDESLTATYGNDGQTPREGREVFEDIESPSELAEAGYNLYQEVSRPRMAFEAKVADIGDVGIGDSVMIIRREHNLYFKARIHKVKVDLLNPDDAEVELGDYEFFKETKAERRSRKDDEAYKRRNTSMIEQLKRQFDKDFNDRVNQFREEFNQAKIDILAEVEADRARMEAEFNQQLDTWTNDFNQDVEQAYKDAEENYARIEQEITTAVDTTRNELEQGYTDAVEQAKRYAEEQSKAHADAVESKLDDVTGSHAGMLADLQSDVMDIDEFLGDSRSLTLDERFQNITQNFEERIRNIDSTHYNIIRGTSFDNPDLFAVHSQVQVITNEVDNFVRMGTGTTNLPYVMNMEYFNVVKGKTYYLVFMYRTTEVPEIDFVEIRPPSEYGTGQKIDLTMTAEEKETVMTGHWTKKVVTVVPDRTMPVRLLLGTNFGAGNTQKGVIDFKKPYLTTTNNREWLPHPDDDTQNVSEIVRRVTLLEDGQSELITRSEYDFDTGNLDQYIKSVEETVEGNKQVLQRVDNWQATNGASIEETIYGFNQKVWLNDISNIGANIIPQSSNAWEDGGLWIANGAEASLLQNLRTKERLPIRPSTTYTLSSNSMYNSNIERVDIHQYLHTGGWINRYTIPRNGEVTFTTWGTASHVRITLIAREGFTIPTSFIDHPDGRVKIKLEVGDRATPMLNAISRIEQLADSISLQVQQLDGEFLTESDIQIRANYVQLGSKQLGDEQFASIFRVSPKSIDAIADNLNITGNVNINGQVTTLAVNALEGRFSNLFATELETIELRARHIGANAIGAQHLWIDQALINKLSASSMFTDMLYAKTINAIDINAGRVRSAILEADVITGTHLAVGTTMIDKLFATSGRIDQLIGKDYFIRNIKAMSIEAVEGNFSSLVTKYFSANYIDVDWISGKNAWFESMYTSNAMIRKLTAQTVFVRDVQAIEITANQLNLDTLRNRFNQIEGGLHITRAKDGVRWIENGVPRGNVPVQTYDSYAGSNIRFNGLNFITDNSHWQTFKYFYTPHEGRILRVVWAVGLLGSSGSASEYVEVQVNGFGNNNQINNGSGSSSRRVFVSRGNTVNITQDIPLPPPNYNMMQAYLQVRRSPSGTGVTNDVFARILHIGQYG
jgi:phage minor structural protein